MAIIPRWQTPISRWSLDGNANDLYGLNNGTPNSVVYTSDCKEGSSAMGSGSVTLPTLIYRTSGYTFSAWFKNPGILNQYKSGSTFPRVNMAYTSGESRLYYYIHSAAGSVIFTDYLSYSDVNNWHHIVITDTGGTVRGYFDGAISTISGTYTPQELTLNTCYISGGLDDVRFYDVALTADEVMNLYKSYAIPIWNQPLHHWKLDGDATDSAGDKNGTAVGSVSYSTSLKVFGSQAFTNSGGANYIDLGSFRPYSSYTSFTWSMWFKTSYSAANQALFGQYTLNSDYVKYMIYLLDGTYYSAGAVAVFCDDATTIKWYGTTTSTYADGNWHFVALTDDNGTAKLYIDGKLTNVTGSYTRFTMASDKCHIGYEDPAAPVKSFNGQIDDVRVYDVALSASDVRALYNSYFTEKASNFMSIL